MTKVREKPPSVEIHEPGVNSFREIIDARLASADASFDEVFTDNKLCEQLILLSGGQPTELMTIVRESIIAHDLPVDQKSLDRAMVEGKREYARLIRQEHWPIIEKVRSTGKYLRSNETEQAFRELLDSRTILQYVNDEEWYGLNPMVAALDSPIKGESPARASLKKKPTPSGKRTKRKS